MKRDTTPGKILFSAVILALTSFSGFAQKKKKADDKLDTRFYDIEIKETTRDGKKYEKDVFEFKPKYMISDYLETKAGAKTLSYVVTKDSTYNEDGEDFKYIQFTIEAKTEKPGETLKLFGTAAGKEINGKVEIYKGDALKRTFEFEGTEQPHK